jgi:hypothetical protein
MAASFFSFMPTPLSPQIIQFGEKSPKDLRLWRRLRVWVPQLESQMDLRFFQSKFEARA